MLQITIPKGELWDEKNEQFIQVEETVLTLEHSLVSLSKWEANWCKPFLSNKEEKTNEQMIDYIKCMCLTQNVKPSVFKCLSSENIKAISNYIDNPRTATCIHENRPAGSARSREIVTSELIYYWMVAYNIPFECQKWHLNRLLTLIRICNIKNQPPKKMSQRQIMSRNAALNAARKQQLHTSG